MVVQAINPQRKSMFNYVFFHIKLRETVNVEGKISTNDSKKMTNVMNYSSNSEFGCFLEFVD